MPRKVDGQEQPPNSGARDAHGRFLPGNPGAWKPGESPNPAGRPCKSKVSEAYKWVLQQPAVSIGIKPEQLAQLGLEKTATVAEAIGVTTARAVLRDDASARTSILNYTEGAPKQDVTTHDGDLESRSTEDIVAEAESILAECRLGSGGTAGPADGRARKAPRPRKR